MKKILFLLFAMILFSSAFSQVTTTLDGSASYDPDGTIVSYKWTQISGPATIAITPTNGIKPSVTFTVAGDYTFQLTVTDNGGATGSDTVHVTVKAANQKPHANAGPDQTIQLPGTTGMIGPNKLKSKLNLKDNEVDIVYLNDPGKLQHN